MTTGPNLGFWEKGAGIKVEIFWQIGRFLNLHIFAGMQIKLFEILKKLIIRKLPGIFCTTQSAMAMGAQQHQAMASSLSWHVARSIYHAQ